MERKSVRLRLCLAIYVCKMFSECKIFLVENILRKGKNFLLFDNVVEIIPENYFLCLLLDVKNLFSKNVSPSQPPTSTTKKKHNPPPPIQNPDWEEGKNRHHFFVAIITHTKSTTTHTKPTKTPPPQQQQN